MDTFFDYFDHDQDKMISKGQFLSAINWINEKKISDVLQLQWQRVNECPEESGISESERARRKIFNNVGLLSEPDRALVEREINDLFTVRRVV